MPTHNDEFNTAHTPVTAPIPAPERHKVHHSYIWLGGIGTAFTVVIVMLFSAFMGIVGEGVNIMNHATPGAVIFIAVGVIALLLVIAGLIVGIQALSYKHLSYELGNEEFSVYSGIFTKKRVHIPYQRIQSVNQRASLLQRIFGVCTVNIDTAGGSTNKAIVVPYVKKSEAERLRIELFSRKQMMLNMQAAAQAGVAPQAPVASQYAAPSGLPYEGIMPAAPTGAPVIAGAPLPHNTQSSAAYSAATAQGSSNVLDAPASALANTYGLFGGEAVDLGRVTYEHGLSNKELILTGLTNNTGFVVMVVALIGGVISIVGQVLQVGIGRTLVDQGVNWAVGFFAENLVGFLIFGIVLLLAVIWIISIVGTCLNYGGFRARRRSTRIEVERGLLQHQFHGVDIDRVQSVIIKQGFIRRIFGYCELSLGKIDAITGSEASEGQKNSVQQGLIIHPFVKLDKVPQILAGLVPEFADVPTNQIKLPGVSLRRALIRRVILHGNGVWLAIVVALVQAFLSTMIQQQVFDADVLTEAMGALAVTPEIYLLNTVCIILYALSAVLFVLDIIGSILWFRGSSFAYNTRFMQITNGGFSRESISFPRKKIQFGTVRSNPFQRRAKVATISVRTAAGITGTTIRLLDVSSTQARSWLSWVTPGGNA